MKKRYDVQFWYYTDQRANRIIEATNEIAALVLAIESNVQYEDWLGNGDGFYIKITRQ